jgi:hypothetical protein
VPQYLGLGPAAYFQSDALFDTMPVDADTVFPCDSDVQRLRDRGVTHVLTQEAVSHPAPELELIRAAPDSFLNRVWARGTAACFLYRLRAATGRVAIEPASTFGQLSWIEKRPSLQVFRVTLLDDAMVSANELMFPGWEVTVDGNKAKPETSGGFRRSVRVDAGEHTIAWTYRPSSLMLGAAISIVTLVMMCVVVLTSRRSPKGALP